MDYFPLLGLAMLGLFVSVAFSGLLGGIIAFGLIDLSHRRKIQQQVLQDRLDKPVRDFLASTRGVTIVDLGIEGDWSPASNELLKLSSMSKSPLLASLAQMEPRHLFQLPYRQLCGQIATIVSTESLGPDDKPSAMKSGLRPLTLALFLAADQTRRSVRSDPSERLSDDDVRSRALAYLDILQIALAEAVQERAMLIAAIVVAITALAVVVPSFDLSEKLSSSQTWMGSASLIVIAAITGLIVFCMLVYAALVIATLTFRGIDRFAAPR